MHVNLPVIAAAGLLATSLIPPAECLAASAPVMDQVVVTAGRIEQNTRQVSANITVVDQEELRRSPSRNLGDLLAEKGISQVRKYPGSLTSVGIRGFRTDTHGNDLQGKVLILLDGRRAGTGNATKLLTQNIERIEIIRGPGAVQYGSAGIGGIINVITRQGRDTSLFVEAGGGSFDTAEGSIGGTAAGAGLDFSGAVTGRTTGDYDTGGGDTFSNTGVDRETGMSLHGGYSFAKHHRLGLIFTGYAVEDAGFPGYFSSVDLDDTTDKDNYSVDLRYTGGSAAGNWQWMTRAFFGQDSNTWYNPVASNPDGWDNGVPDKNTTDQQGAQAQLSSRLGNLNITGGFDYVRYEVENSWSPQRSTYDNPALFILAGMGWWQDRLVVNAGLRHDWFTVKVEEPAGREEDQNHLTPQIGLTYNPTDQLKLRLQYAQGFMMPSADQLAIDASQWGTRTVGNPDLEPEKSATWEAGADYRRAGFNGSLSYFYTDFEDKIVTAYRGDGSQSWANRGDAVIAGFETELGYDLGEPLGWQWEVRPYLNVTLLTQFEEQESDSDLQYVSDTIFAAGLVADNARGLFFRFNVAYTGEQEIQDYESGTFPPPVVDLESSTVADLTASWRFLETERHGAFTLRGELTNLFDEEYAYVKGSPMSGRGVFVSLRWDF
jgi:vitamin B12 transporter